MQAGSGVDLCSQGGCDAYENATVVPYESFNMMYVNSEGNVYHWRSNRKSEAEVQADRAQQGLYTLGGLAALVAVLLLLGPE